MRELLATPHSEIHDSESLMSAPSRRPAILLLFFKRERDQPALKSARRRPDKSGPGRAHEPPGLHARRGGALLPYVCARSGL